MKPVVGTYFKFKSLPRCDNQRQLRVFVHDRGDEEAESLATRKRPLLCPSCLPKWSYAQIDRLISQHVMIVVVRSAPAFFHFMNHIAVESNDVTPKSVNSSRHCFQFLLGLRLPKNDISALQNLQKTMQEWPQLLDNCLTSVHLPPAATASQTPSIWTKFPWESYRIRQDQSTEPSHLWCFVFLVWLPLCINIAPRQEP